ncbi:hypothetical protein CHLNCDRAFT_55571 [Chlorella variabilis]|uniref:Protein DETOXIFICATION n=1 Tax=Chlorella variabilis TaxID=554065 RepID=E1ZTR1_CHLVA|nr:hypothetical protein CHLNCDRAFT_55571 [Chlorella variabilis]EFN50757.1 hypothetical protein CHLNCDRAFT_55571 [Chlorella variabilis]|eukprot:XP_005842869.1 hypothetical protein CHLNCDRAFT_55571 [Chlorella variabilis]
MGPGMRSLQTPLAAGYGWPRWAPTPQYSTSAFRQARQASFKENLFAFLGVGTTNLIASNSLKTAGLDSRTRLARREAAERTLCNSLQLAVACGLLAAAALLAGGRTFFAAMGTAPELLVPAWQYLSIRVLAAPAVLATAVSQGACLGQQDAWTPFKVLRSACSRSMLLLACSNLHELSAAVCPLDLPLPSACSGRHLSHLVPRHGRGGRGGRHGGNTAAGVHTPTFLAASCLQYLGAAYFIWYLWRHGSQPDSIRLRWTEGLPRAGQMREFQVIAVTLFTRTIFGMAAYFRQGGGRLLAMNSFWFLAYFPEPLSLAAQSMLARDKGRPQRAAYWAWLLLRSGAVLGLGLAAAVGALSAGRGWMFTTDVAVQAAVRQLAPVAMAAISVCSVMMMFDGISVGSGSFAHLPRSNVAGLGVTLAALHAGRQAGLGLGAVWWALVAFYSTRLLGHLLHFWRCQGGVFAAEGAVPTATVAS